MEAIVSVRREHEISVTTQVPVTAVETNKAAAGFPLAIHHKSDARTRAAPLILATPGVSNKLLVPYHGRRV